MYAKAGIKFSYAVHLRDTGTVSRVANLDRICYTEGLVICSTDSSFHLNGSGLWVKRLLT